MLTKEDMIDKIINRYGFENEITIAFARTCGIKSRAECMALMNLLLMFNFDLEEKENDEYEV